MNRRMEYRAPNEDLVLTEAAIPEPPVGGAVIKLHYSGICHSDVHLWEDKVDLGHGNVYKRTGSPTFKFPAVLGHEMSGEIFSIGPNVKGGDFIPIGTRVIVYPWLGCETCGECKDGKPNLCPRVAATTLGVCREGGYQEYVVAPQIEYVYPVPAGLPMDVAALLACSGLTAYNAITAIKPVLEEFNRKSGQANLLIVGAGGLGLWGIQIARAMMPKGTTIIVAEALESKLEEARIAGADETLLWAPDDTPETNIAEVKKLLPGGLNAVVDFVGSGTTTTSGFGHLCKNGSMVVVGLFGGLMTLPAPFLPLRCNTITGVYTGSPQQIGQLIKLAADEKIRPPPISHVMLEETQTVLEDLRAGKRRGRSIIKF